jgi:hypothetical protein
VGEFLDHGRFGFLFYCCLALAALLVAQLVATAMAAGKPMASAHVERAAVPNTGGEG